MAGIDSFGHFKVGSNGVLAMSVTMLLFQSKCFKSFIPDRYGMPAVVEAPRTKDAMVRSPSAAFRTSSVNRLCWSGEASTGSSIRADLCNHSKLSKRIWLPTFSVTIFQSVTELSAHIARSRSSLSIVHSPLLGSTRSFSYLQVLIASRFFCPGS